MTDEKRIFGPEVSYAEWRRVVESQLGGESFDEIMTGRADGVDFEALCTATHPRPLVALALDADGPGRSPGSAVSWVPCQRFGDADPEELKHHLSIALEGGIKGIHLRLDRISLQGEESSASPYRWRDLSEVFQGAPKSWQVLFLDAGGGFLPGAAELTGWMEEAGIDVEEKTLLLGSDPLTALARDASLPS